VILAPEPKKYEIRLIIWETFNIPRVDGDKVDIYLEVVYDPFGWNSDD